MATILRWMILLLAAHVPADRLLVDPLQQVARFEAPRAEARRAATSSSEPGHGAFCSHSSAPSVFLGRDLPEVSGYGEFQEWCEERGGRIGWQV